MTKQIAVLDPDILSVSEDVWNCPTQRDNFLNHFLCVSGYIEDVESLKIAWCQRMDELLWSAPQNPPWRADKDWSNALWPVIYKKLTKLTERIDVATNVVPCSIEPDFICSNNEMYEVFLEMLATASVDCEHLLVGLSLSNIPAQDYLCLLNGEKLIPTPIFAQCRNDYLSIVDIVKCHWPNSIIDKAVFKAGVKLMLLREHDIEWPQVDYVFSDNFIRKLIGTVEDQSLIMECICNRLIMTHSAARACGRLQDEEIVGSGGTYRIRVTPRPSSKRIHYHFRDGLIEFVMFYDRGEHDDGL